MTQAHGNFLKGVTYDMESILVSIKKLLGIEEEYKHFDTDLVIQINSVLSVLTQIGVGPREGFEITGDSETWHDFMGKDFRIDVAKSFVYLKVKLLFDPPTNSSLIESMNNLISEFEWRLLVVTETV